MHEVKTIFDDFGSMTYQCDDEAQAKRYIDNLSDPDYPPHVDKTVSYIRFVQYLVDGEVVEQREITRS